MHSSAEARYALRPLALAQAGVVSREQALAYGVTPRVLARLVRDQHWRRLEPGVFLTADADPTFLARAWTGVLIGGDRARLGGRAAGHLHGVDDVEPETVTVLVPAGTRVSRRPGLDFVRERDGRRHPRTTGAPPRLGVEDTVLDLCEEGSPEDAVGWVTAAVQRRRTSVRRLRQALARRGRQRHRAVLEALLHDVEQGAESPLEVTFLRDVERAHDLPRSSRQVRARDGRTVRDVLYEAQGVAVELDGRVGHTELGRFRDMWRDNTASVAGLVTLRYGAHDLHGRPCEVAMQLAAVLTGRGWAGWPRRCSRCKNVC